MTQKVIELQGEIDEFTVILGDSNTPFSEMDRSSRKKISKDMVELNSTTDQLNIIDIYRPVIRQQQTHSSQAHMEYLPR